jgi:hypothetical protein
VAAAVAAITAVLQLAERDWLRGGNGLLLAATFALIATGLPERSVGGKLLTYGFLAAALILVGIRMTGS